MKKIWRMWLGSQSPKRSLLKWGSADKAGLLLVCLVTAVVSSYKLLAVPDIKPGDLSSFEAIAPKEALITDSIALQKKRSELLSLTFVQVIDKKESKKLLNTIIENTRKIERYIEKNEIDRLPIRLSEEEKIWLKKINQKERDIYWKRINLVSKRMLSQGLVKNLDKEQLRESISSQLSEFKSEGNNFSNIGTNIIIDVFYGKSNLRHDPNRSQKLFEQQITEQVIPKYPLIKQGDIIIRKGERITQKRFDILSHYGLIKSSPRPYIWFIKFTEVFAICGILLLILRREKPRLKARQALLSLGLLLIVQISKIWFGASISPLGLLLAPTLLLSQGIGTSTALAWMAIGSLVWPMPVGGIGEGRLIIASIASALVAFLGGRMRSRAQILQIVVLVPFVALAAEWFFFNRDISNKILPEENVIQNPESLFTEAIFVSAMLMITILLIPIIENTFGLLTNARLMELMDQEKPLLRRLSKEAPGTFEHTLTICGLAEEGARSIGADIDLIRTGALYHDVGKLHAPDWFIENQDDGINPHDQINDPYKSAEVLQAHVDEGLKLARRYRLPSPIADFIPEHQGTLKMGYFLHQARQRDPSVSEAKFRYKGPIPRSKETAILMLADGCEAALRSLDSSTNESEASTTIKKIIESRQKDGQLLDSNLSRAELELINRGFVRVWKRMRHRRLKYPISSKKVFK